MSKFFRKYSKWLLAVFGSLLMIVFLVPQVASMMQDAGSQGAAAATVGTSNDSIPLAEWQRIQSEVQMLQQMQSRQPTGMIIPGIGGAPQSPEHWYLLVREAEQAGLIGGLASSGLSEDALQAIAIGLGGNRAFYQQTFARVAGVNELIGMYATGGTMSDRRLRAEAQRLFGGARVRMVVLEADDTAAAPTEAQLQTQLDAWADTVRGEGDHGFGYRLPDRFKIEYIQIPAAAVRASLENSTEMGPVKLRRYWREHETDPLYPALEGQIEIPQVVRDGRLQELTDETLAEIANFAERELQKPTRGLGSGLLDLPDDWDTRRLALPALAEMIIGKFRIEEITYTEATETWLDAVALGEIENVGYASTDKWGQPMSAVNLVAELREFGGGGSFPMQEGVAAPAVSNPEGSLSIFRVTATDPARSPVSVDEVRDELVSDLARLARYEALVAQSATFLEEARTDGMLSLALSNDTIVQRPTSVQLYNPQFMIRLPIILPVLGQNEAIVDEILEHVHALPKITSLDQLTPEQRYFVLDVPDNLAVAVVEIAGLMPLTSEQYRTLAQSASLQNYVLLEEFGDTNGFGAAFEIDRMIERHNFKQQTSSFNDSFDFDDDDEAGDGTNEEGAATP